MYADFFQKLVFFNLLEPLSFEKLLPFLLNIALELIIVVIMIKVVVIKVLMIILRKKLVN